MRTANRDCAMNTALRWFLFLILMLLPPAAASAQEETYKIAPGDSLEISVWKDPDLTRQMVVPPDGILSLPLFPELTEDEVDRVVTSIGIALSGAR